MCTQHKKDKDGKEDMSYMPKSKSDVHETPDIVFQFIKEHWGYSKEEMFDPCPVDPTFDGLDTYWTGLNFVNPPYSLLKEFVIKAFNERDLYHNVSIMLLPAKTDQEWFHNILERRSEIKWIRKRLKFKGAKWSATQPHFLVKIE